MEKIATPIAPSTQKPVWDYQCITHIPNLYLESQVSIQLYDTIGGWTVAIASFPNWWWEGLGMRLRSHASYSPFPYSVMGLSFKCGASRLMARTTSCKMGMTVKLRGSIATLVVPALISVHLRMV